MFVSLADPIIQQSTKTLTPLFVCGGTGLYLHALTHGLFQGPGASVEVRRQLRKEAEESGIEALHQRLQEIDKAAAKRIAKTDYVRIERALEVYMLT